MSKVASWLVWLLILAGNGFIVFLWLVFGLAAAGTLSNTIAGPFIWATSLGGGIPLCLSLYCMIREKFIWGLLLALLMVPGIFAANVSTALR